MFTDISKSKKSRVNYAVISFLLLLTILGGIIAPVGSSVASAVIHNKIKTTIVEGINDTGNFLFNWADTSPLRDFKDFTVGAVKTVNSVLDNPLDTILGGALNMFAELIKWFSIWIFGAGASLLDTSIEFSISSASFKFQGLKDAWTTIRDVANIAFIFILLYIAIATILQLGGYQTKRVLTALIIAALFINFSFFLTGVVIDSGNILALALWNNITHGGTPGESISDHLRSNLDVESVFTENTFNTLSYFQKATANILTAALFVITGFVFLSAAILFILRTIVLMFLIIFSPLAFVAYILPDTKRHFNKWLNMLIHHTFLAPVFMLMILIVLSIAPGILKLANPSQAPLANAISPQKADDFQILFGYIIMMGLIVMALTVSKSMAGSAGSLSVRWAGRATGMAAGAAGWAGRRSGGRVFARMRDSEWAKNQAVHGRGFKKWAGRGMLYTGDKGAKSSWDIRTTGAGRAVEGGLTSLGVTGSFGRAGGRGGYDETIKQRAKRSERLDEILRDSKATAKDREPLKETNRQVLDAKAEQRKMEGFYEGLGPADKVRYKPEYERIMKRHTEDVKEAEGIHEAEETRITGVVKGRGEDRSRAFRTRAGLKKRGKKSGGEGGGGGGGEGLSEGAEDKIREIMEEHVK